MQGPGARAVARGGGKPGQGPRQGPGPEQWPEKKRGALSRGARNFSGTPTGESVGGDLGVRLKGICQHINDNFDVEGLCEELPYRIQEIIEAEGESCRNPNTRVPIIENLVHRPCLCQRHGSVSLPATLVYPCLCVSSPAEI